MDRNNTSVSHPGGSTPPSSKASPNQGLVWPVVQSPLWWPGPAGALCICPCCLHCQLPHSLEELVEVVTPRMDCGAQGCATQVAEEPLEDLGAVAVDLIRKYTRR